MKTMPNDINLKLMKNMPVSMAYNGEISFEDWQEKAYKKLEELLGLPYEKCDLLFEKEYEKECDDYYEVRFQFQSEEGYFVPCHLLTPKTDKETYPLMICLQGHGPGMHISLGRPKYEGDLEGITSGDRDFAVTAVKNGFCAVTLEQRCMGECGGTPKPDCFLTAMTAILIGRTLIGERVWDVSRLIDVVENEFPHIDKNQIYCMGNSGGGTASFYAACIEKRISGVMPSCSLCTYDDSISPMRHCACNYIPKIRQYFNMGTLCGLVAPRALVIVSGRDDDIFPIEGAKATFKEAAELYKYAGAENKCAQVIGEGGHRFYADASWKVFKNIVNQ